jgi:hypothetical protein
MTDYETYISEEDIKFKDIYYDSYNHVGEQ